MKACFVSSFARAALVAAAAFVAVDASAVTGELLSRGMFNQEDPDLVTDPEILAGLRPGSSALAVTKGSFVKCTIPDKLRDAPGRPYTFVIKFKTQIENDWLPLVNMPASNTLAPIIGGCHRNGLGFFTGKLRNLRISHETEL